MENTVSKASTVPTAAGKTALAQRLAAIDQLCAMRGTQYQGLRRYRSL